MASDQVDELRREVGSLDEKLSDLQRRVADLLDGRREADDLRDEDVAQGPVAPNPRARKYTSDRSERLRRWIQWFSPLPNKPKVGSPNREELEAQTPAIKDAAIAADLLQEAESIMAMRDERIASAESKATTLMGTVAIAASLVVAGSALILDPGKVTDGWREALMLIAAALLLLLLMTGYVASRALMHVLTLSRPRVRHSWQRAKLGNSAASRRALAIDVMARAGANRYVADYKLAQVRIAYRWYRLALVGFLVLGLTIAAYALVGVKPA